MRREFLINVQKKDEKFHHNDPTEWIYRQLKKTIAFGGSSKLLEDKTDRSMNGCVPCQFQYTERNFLCIDSKQGFEDQDILV